MKALGVIGGMGPQATADFLKKIIDFTDTVVESEHIRVYVDNHPQIPDRMKAILENGESPLGAMRESLEKLELCGAQCIVMPCITAHYYYDELVKSAHWDFLNLPDVVACACSEKYAGKTAGVLSTKATRDNKIIINRLEKAGINYITPSDEEQDVLTELIYRVKTNKDMGETVEKFKPCIESMASRGADYFILGCTEIPVIAGSYGFNYDYIDVTSELAKAAIIKCDGKLKH